MASGCQNCPTFFARFVHFISGTDTELGKQKVKLSLSQKEEWQEWHAGKVQALADLRGQIAALDGAIDRLVYGLYGLNEAEIALVEGSG